MNRTRLLWLLSVALVLSLVAWYAQQRWHKQKALAGLTERLAHRVGGRAGARLPCALILKQRPLVLLILGQSNAGNHGVGEHRLGAPVNVIADDGHCYLSTDPLPGATGAGNSIWSRLPAALAAEGFSRPLVFGVLAVDASTAGEWSASEGPLPVLLDRLLQQMSAAGMPPNLVLWQQGEADARAQTTAVEYQTALVVVSRRLRAAGVGVPMVLARSTVCRSGPVERLRTVVQDLADQPGFAEGPDTDTLLSPAHRSDGCHFNESGLQEAAALWARTLIPLAATREVGLHRPIVEPAATELAVFNFGVQHFRRRRHNALRIA